MHGYQRIRQALLKIWTLFGAERNLPNEFHRIFYIDGMHILEAGSHDELMEKKGAYYKLYQSQFEE